MIKYIVLPATFLFLILSSCKKDQAPVTEVHDTNILTYSIQNSPAKVSIVTPQQLITISFPVTVIKADDLIADFTLSPGCKATVNNIEQVSGISKNNYTKVFFYTVSNGGSKADWKVTATNNNYTTNQGLGNFLQQTASNNCTYPWYWDQANTGPYSLDNSGPSVVTMASKWADSNFTKTPEDARKAYRPAGGNWNADEITFYLRDNNIPNLTIALPNSLDSTTQLLKRQVDLHQLVIVEPDIYIVRYNANPHLHIDRFYDALPGVGLFIIIKGYKEVDNELYFEVYDPNSWTRTYDDGNLMGKDRYYRSEDLFEATKNWWPKVFIVAKKGTTVIE